MIAIARLRRLRLASSTDRMRRERAPYGFISPCVHLEIVM